MTWGNEPGVIELPDGARLRGRGLRREDSPEPEPEWGLYLLGRDPAPQSWPSRWLRWPDFWLPRDPAEAREAFAEAHRRALSGDRVEVDDALFEGSTEKVDTEVPSAVAGHVRALLVEAGQTVPVGTELTVEGYRARDGSYTAVGRTFLLGNGERLFLGGSAENVEAAPK